MKTRLPLATAMLLAVDVSARSDNSLSNLLGFGNIDSLFLNLEEKQ